MAKIDSIDINEIIKTEGKFNRVKNKLIKENNADFSTRKNMITIVADDGEMQITRGNAILNLLFLQFYCGLNLKSHLKLEDIFQKSSISQNDIADFFNKMKNKMYTEDLCTFEEYRDRIYSMLNEQNLLSTKVTVLSGDNTIDYLSFLEEEDEYPELNQLFHPKFSKKMSYKDVENKFNDNSKKLEKFYTDHSDTVLHDVYASKSGISGGQAAQTLSFVGLKPDIVNGGLIPNVIKTNFMTGLKSIEDYYTNCIGTRSALMTNNKYTSSSGYLQYKLAKLMVDTWHDNNIDDCGSKHYVRYQIKSQKYLDIINGRHYYEIPEDSEDADTSKILTITKNDTHMIGRTIGLRSPITCCSNSDHNRVCSTCYGKELSEINKNMHTGLMAVSRLNEPLTQTLISAKHLLHSDISPIEWDKLFPNFHKDFEVSMDEIYFSETVTKVKLILPEIKEDDFDEEEGLYKINYIDIIDEDNDVPARLLPPVPMFVSSEVIDRNKDKSNIIINSDEYDSDVKLFKFIPHNNMLSTKLLEIVNLIENNEHSGVNTIDELVNKFADLLISNNININLINAEMICSKLIKDNNNHNIDWSKEEIPEYHINRVSKSVMEAPLGRSLAFERILDQIFNLDTYDKNDPSMFDWMYR